MNAIFLKILLFVSLALFGASVFAAKKTEAPATNAVTAKVNDEETKKAAAAAKAKTIGGVNGGGRPYPLKAEEPDESWKALVAVDERKVKQEANQIDNVVDKILAEKKVVPLPITSDEVFLRRVTLDLAGRIPSPNEIKTFVSSTRADKRAQIIKDLVNSEGYVNHQFSYWADLLRIEALGFGQRPTAYPEYIKSVFRDNMPYDYFVRSLITADGWTTETNGATGFILRDMRQGVLDHVSQIATVFLGSQIGCAMCHDAKFEKWKQTNFYALTAYFSEITLTKDQAFQKELREREKEAKGDPKLINVINRERLQSAYLVTDRPGKEQKLPADYKYDPALRDTVIKPNILYGTTPEQLPGESRRSAFARWLTARDNPNFTRNIANRYWQRMFGIGLIEPVDDLSDTNDPSSKELMDLITKIMIDEKYNLKAFLSVLANTKLYQRSTSPKSVNFETFVFDSHPLRRLSAQQLFDSLATLYLGDKIQLAEPILSPNFAANASTMVSFGERMGDGGNLGGANDTKFMQAHANEMKAKAMNTSMEASSDDASMNTMSGTSMSSMSALTEESTTMGNSKMTAMESYKQKLRDKRMAANKNAETESPSMVATSSSPQPLSPAELKKMGIQLSAQMGPPREGSFLDQFGASIRDIVNTGTTEPNITQTLTLMNGQDLLKISQVNAQNSLTASLMSAKDLDTMFDLASWRILGRKPTASEIAAFKDYEANYTSEYSPGKLRNQELVSDLVWSMMNLREFLFYK